MEPSVLCNEICSTFVRFNLQIANAATERLSVPLCMAKPQFCLFLSIETGPC